jgi:hypothetical protein
VTAPFSTRGRVLITARMSGVGLGGNPVVDQSIAVSCPVATQSEMAS